MSCGARKTQMCKEIDSFRWVFCSNIRLNGFYVGSADFCLGTVQLSHTHTHTYKQTKGKHLYNMGPSMSISVNIWMINHITTGLFALIFRKGIRNSHCSTRFYCCCCCHVKIAFYSLIAKKPDKIGKKQQQWRHYNTHIKT